MGRGDLFTGDKVSRDPNTYTVTVGVWNSHDHSLGLSENFHLFAKNAEQEQDQILIFMQLGNLFMAR